jgi:hypothetical protein
MIVNDAYDPARKLARCIPALECPMPGAMSWFWFICCAGLASPGRTRAKNPPFSQCLRAEDCPLRRCEVAAGSTCRQSV